MKGLGLAGAGLGAAAATTPVFHDMDEVLSAGSNGYSYPWYVKEVDQTTVEYDWQSMVRYDKRGQYDPNIDTNAEGDYPTVGAQWAAEQKASLIAAVKSGKMGVRHQDIALLQASWNRFYDYPSFWAAPIILSGFRVPGGSCTPEELGVSRLNQSPEENSRMLMAALSFFGASHVSFQELDTNRQKLIFANDTRGTPYVFKDIDTNLHEDEYETAEGHIIPNKCKWVISAMLPNNLGLDKVKGSYENYMGGAAVGMAYNDLTHMTAHALYFLFSLGFRGFSGNPGHVNGFAILGGQGELSRSNIMIHPILGAEPRVPNMIITDMPLAPTKPIDFGANRFCHTCTICADGCPSDSINKDSEPSWETTGPWNAGGVKCWYVDWKKCLPYRNMRYTAQCANCQATCVFSKFSLASIHDIVKAVVATTPIFNGFFTNMDSFFGYGGLSPEQWWDRKIPYAFDDREGGWGAFY
jgi:reductive dehalogenase